MSQQMPLFPARAMSLLALVALLHLAALWQLRAAQFSAFESPRRPLQVHQIAPRALRQTSSTGAPSAKTRSLRRKAPAGKCASKRVDPVSPTPTRPQKPLVGGVGRGKSSGSSKVQRASQLAKGVKEGFDQKSAGPTRARPDKIEQAKSLAKARASALAALARIGRGERVGPPAQTPATRAKGGRQSRQREIYSAQLTTFLQQELQLPEYGAVCVQLQLKATGGYIAHRVISSDSHSNRAHLETQLPKLQFPRFSGAGDQIQSFTLNFSNRLT